MTAIERLPEQPLAPDGAQGTREQFLSLLDEADAFVSKDVAAYIDASKGEVDGAWIKHLALHTQVTIKKSAINYAHGRLLYSALRNYLARQGDSSSPIAVFETGTARGFSAVCMAKAMSDADRLGSVTTIDILPHNQKMFWNCIDDLEGQKTRRELLSPWSDLLNNITFLQHDTTTITTRLHMPRIHFAFLDASHTFEDVMNEFNFVEQRQQSGDIVVFDDVTPNTFPGVVRAVHAISSDYNYEVKNIASGDHRGYAIACKR